jgi:hypothetical protein
MDGGEGLGRYTIVYGTPSQLYVVRGLSVGQALLRASHWSQLRRPNVTIFCPKGQAYGPSDFDLLNDSPRSVARANLRAVG